MDPHSSEVNAVQNQAPPPFTEISRALCSLYTWCRSIPAIRTGKQISGEITPTSHSSLCKEKTHTHTQLLHFKIAYPLHSPWVSHTSITTHTPGARIRALHVPGEHLQAFYGRAAAGWNEPSFLSEMATPEHILYFDLDIYLASGSQWTSVHAIRTVTFFGHLVS